MYRSGVLTCLLALAGPGVIRAGADDEIQSLRQRAEALRKRGELKLVVAPYERALSASEARAGKSAALRTATICLDLGGVYQDLHQYEKAQQLYLRCLQLRERHLEKNHIDIAIALNNLGELYRAVGRPTRAAAQLERGLAIKEAQRQRNDLSIATTLNLLALVQQDLGLLDKAEQLHVRALRLRRARLDPSHPDVHRSMHNLAAVYKLAGKLSKAEELYKECLAIWEKKLGPNDPAVATALFNLAAVYQDYQDRHAFAKAEALYRRSLKIREDALGKDHPAVAETLNHLAGLRVAMDEPAEAERLYRRCLRIRTAKLGEEHPAVSQTLSHLALLLERQGKTTEAADLLDRARRISHRHVGHVLPALPERDQVRYLTHKGGERDDLERALAMQLVRRLTTSRAASAVMSGAATWLLNGKAIAQEALARSAVLSRDEGNPALRGLAAGLREVRAEIARLSLSPAEPGQEAARQKRLGQLRAEEEKLAARLAQEGSGAVAPADWFDLAAVRKGLPAGAVLIDVARVRSFDFQGAVGDRWGPARYVAWVTPADGKLAAFDLGPAREIDLAVRAVREALKDAPSSLKAKGEPAAERELRKPLEKLSRLVLTKPLLEHVGRAKRWVVSPDGNLWMVPWEMLLLPDGKYAVEKHTLSYALSGRDVAGASSYKGRPSRPLVVADPDFDLVAKTADADRDRIRNVRRLAGTRLEAKAIDQPLRDLTGTAPVLLMGEQAVKGKVKGFGSPRVLVFATHGFFYAETRSRVPANPLERCGLLLAGCNYAARASGADNGILTGLEVLGMDLRGCEMVVLSACETGLGDVRVGEGVAGLRQAFRLAGAGSVVSSLWQVPDRQSARLMGYFFQALARGGRRSEALCQAQRKLIAERQEENAAAHPLFWAAFTVTGAGRD